MMWLSALTSWGSPLFGGVPLPWNHQYDATPQLTPPLSERQTSMLPAQTLFSSVGSTTRTLSYQPWCRKLLVGPKPHSTSTALTGFERSRVSCLFALWLRTCVVQEPASPLDCERKTASRPS